MKRYIEAGRLGSPRGLKGEIRFICYCDSPEFLSGVKRLYLDPEGRKDLEILLYRPTIPAFIFKGFEQRELAGVLNGRTLWFDRRDVALPEGVFYNCDLLGETVYRDETGEKIGLLADVEEGVNNFFYLIQKEDGTSFRLPAVDEFVVSAVPGKGIRLRLPQGIDE